jgi:hypothetical protein
LSQKAGLMPKALPRRMALSGVTPRRPLTRSLTRLTVRPVACERRAWLMAELLEQDLARMDGHQGGRPFLLRPGIHGAFFSELGK